jgi:uncharacterized lipoprotein NlpE involved in copper resistance
MKKVIVCLLVLVMLLVMAGCGNKNVGYGNYSFKKVHVDTRGFSGCLTVKSWRNDEVGIEVNTEEASAIFLSEGTYILLEGSKACPFCPGKK